ncbi:ATP-dependent DNA helicase RecG [Nocardioides sp. TRM66260-LWL]|uniref:ATP-dependent DNA helicase RecG n=1 Tax=Nocardioides sp. TRM66260-LWL TaxID=2874478 RepID=UPI001CC646DC|nr:ATP-dependent DNA helicase RecG [Nocardioides sp. TRM66260-LWL]MBZ5733142.1 ATP-dependent DNA helicase RecG [Nocardioides sp. TRM66260-LWL]
MIGLDSPVDAVLGDVRKAQKKRDAIVERLGLATVGDLLHHLPRRYLKTGELTEVAALEEGEMITVIGEIRGIEAHSYTDRRTGGRRWRVGVDVATDGPRLRMTFFAKHGSGVEYHRKRLPVGRRGMFQGTVGRFREEWTLTNPQIVLFGDGDGDGDAANLALGSFGELYPIYPLTKGVETWELQRAVAFALTVLDDVDDPIPAAVRERHDLPDLVTAFRLVHLPRTYGDVTRGQRRFRFEEALVTQLVLGRRRRELARVGAQARDGGDGALLAAFDARLPFELTAGQREVGERIAADLAEPRPMNRLLQGEVGSGKTLVALRAMLHVVDSGGQAALLAPTEVLAQQHHRSITAMLGDLAEAGQLTAPAAATRVELLTGSMTKGQRTAPLSRLASGESGIVIGTHALLEQQVQFADLGLVVVDEQHRFGVEQRAALTEKSGGAPPHVLVMTATPIPRTVAMTVFGDLEVSTLRELPAGRAPIQTTVVPLADAPHWFGRVWERVREEVEKGHQVYVVCPRITGDVAEQGVLDDAGPEPEPPTARAKRPEKAAAPPLHAVEEVLAELSYDQLAGLRLAALHGRLPAEEKERTMRAFGAGELDVLVSTTVIEVGVDVANATTMVLLDADRFGVSQLHQLRGRVGRGGLPGLCLLVTRARAGSDARERLEAVAATTDGFELSRVDLQMRREGDVLGRSQSGWRSSLQNLRVLRDEATIVAAREAAETLLDADEALRSTPRLAAAVSDLEASVAAEFMEKA